MPRLLNDLLKQTAGQLRGECRPGLRNGISDFSESFQGKVLFQNLTNNLILQPSIKIFQNIKF